MISTKSGIEEWKPLHQGACEKRKKKLETKKKTKQIRRSGATRRGEKANKGWGAKEKEKQLSNFNMDGKKGGTMKRNICCENHPAMKKCVPRRGRKCYGGKGKDLGKDRDLVLRGGG